MTNHVQGPENGSWLVVDCPFNQAWYPDLVGKTVQGRPPAYASVTRVKPPLVTLMQRARQAQQNFDKRHDVQLELET